MRHYIQTLTLLTLLLLTTKSQAQTQTQQLDQLLQQYQTYNKFNGSVLVAHQGKVVYKKGFGEANMEWNIPNAANTKHRLGSITKQFTAMLILQLAAEGKLDLQTPISKYLPDYPKANGDKITTHHLLTHTSGIPNYTAMPGFFKEDSRDPYSPEEFVKKFADKELEFTPGERFNYSNSGYFLLGVLIEKLSGKTYEQMLQDKIFTPLGMKDSGYDQHGVILKNRATGYEKRGVEFVNSDYLDMSIPYASGSMYSTVEDLYLWDQALYTTALLPKKYMDLYFQPAIPSFGGTHYAYGWRIGKEPIGNTTDSIAVISHGGGINGFNTIISRSTTDKSLVVLLNNTGGAPLEEMAIAIRGILAGKTYDLPKKSLAFDMLGLIETKGLDAGLSHYQANKTSAMFDFNEGEVNQIGYQLLGDGKLEAAAAMFKLNMEAYPKSANTYDSYAEALMNLGDNAGAIKYYTTAVEMDPSNQGGLNMLEKLGADTKGLVKEHVVPEHLLATYVGSYELQPGFVLTITKEGSQLKAQATGQPMLDIFPKSDTVFYLKAVQAQIAFNKGANGAIESLTLFQGGKEMVGRRLAH